MSLYLVRALDAKYDAENEMLVLNLFFEDLKQQRIVSMRKAEWIIATIGKNIDTSIVPDEDMVMVANNLKNRDEPFRIEINDDPNINKINENDKKTIDKFRNELGDRFESITEKFNDEDEQVDRRLERVMKKERDRNEEMRKLMEGEA